MTHPERMAAYLTATSAWRTALIDHEEAARLHYARTAALHGYRTGAPPYVSSSEWEAAASAIPAHPGRHPIHPYERTAR